MKKVLRRLAAIALLALIGVLAAVPAWATTYTFEANNTSVKFNKFLVVDSDANIPDVTFNYTIARGTPVAASGTNVQIFGDGDCENGSISSGASFSNADTPYTTAGLPSDLDSSSPTAGKKYATKEIVVSFGANSFTKPGIYRFVITETPSSDYTSKGVTYDAATTRYLDVYVSIDDADNTKLYIENFTMRTAAENITKNATTGDYEYVVGTGAKSAGFTNTITEYDFKFTKTIGGNQGDTNKRFTFTLNISNALPGVYAVTANDVTGNPTTITVGTGGTYTGTFELTSGSSFEVLGLNKDAVCAISEANQDYTPSYVVDSGSPVSGNSASAIILAQDTVVAFTNTRSGAVPTGVIIAVAPFAAGLVIFGGGAVYLTAKKNRDDE